MEHGVLLNSYFIYCHNWLLIMVFVTVLLKEWHTEGNFLQCFQPVELLPKQISDFKEEYIPRGLPMQTICAVHREYERERLSKSMKCFCDSCLINRPIDTDW